jgi:geranylgeranyl reductase family protein
MTRADSRARRVDVAIIGAGPAGAIAAEQLARGGASVVLIEKESLPRYKTCGGGLVRRALRFLPEGFELPAQDECRTVELRFASGLSFRADRSEPIVAMTMRSELDHALTQAAVRAGAELRSPCELVGLAQDAVGVDLATSTGPLRAQIVIAADGALSRTARFAGWSESVDAVAAIEAEITLTVGAIAPFRGVARFDLGTPEAGYGWVFPKRGQLSAGVLSMRRKSGGLRDALQSYLGAIDPRGVVSSEEHGFVIPIAPRRTGFTRGRVLLVGDAAGLADPLTGEGISLAMHSGRLAAESLQGAQFDPRSSCAAYEARLKREILADLRIARALAKLLYHRPKIAQRLFERSGRALCEAMTDVVCGERTYRELVYSPRSCFMLLRAHVGA